MEIFSTIIFLFCGLVLIYDLYVHHNKKGRLIDQIPGPPCLPVIGTALFLFNDTGGMWSFFRRMAVEHYPVYRYWFGPTPVVCISHPDDIRIILTDRKNLDKSPFYNLLHPLMNQGLITCTGDKHSERRSNVTPAFHVNMLREYFHKFVRHTKSLVETLNEEIRSGSVTKELSSMSSAFALNIICDTTMGINLSENDNPVMNNNEYIRAMHSYGLGFLYRTARPWLMNDFIFSMTAKGRKQSKYLETLHRFTSNIISTRKQYHEETGWKYLEVAENSDEKLLAIGSERKKLALIDHLIARSQNDPRITDDVIQDEVNTFVIAGNDTVATAMMFTIKLLAENKDIQRRAREEVLKEIGEEMAFSGIQKLNYLEMCIKESLRLYPNIPTISRKTTTDLQLKHCFVPAETILAINFYDTHRDPNFWPLPNVFDPDRFLPEQCAKRHQYAYTPFSAGIRFCIGHKFAMLELKTVIAGLLQHFTFEPIEEECEMRMVPHITLKCENHVNVKFIPVV